MKKISLLCTQDRFLPPGTIPEIRSRCGLDAKGFITPYWRLWSIDDKEQARYRSV
jgi:hypothetical protein